MEREKNFKDMNTSMMKRPEEIVLVAKVGKEIVQEIVHVPTLNGVNGASIRLQFVMKGEARLKVETLHIKAPSVTTIFLMKKL